MIVQASFDDGAKEDLRIAELMDKYSIKDVTFYIPSDWYFTNEIEKREPLNESDVLQLHKNYKVGSHTVTHPMLTRVPFWDAQIEITESKDQLENLLQDEVDSFCYPRGYANDKIRDEVKKHYKTARNTLVGSVTKSEDPIWQSTSVHVAGNRRKEYEGTTWLKEGFRLLDEAARTKDSVFHFWGHSHEISKHDGWYDFEQLLKRIDEVTHT